MYRKATELEPNYPTAHQWLGEALNTLGRSEDGIREVSKALEYDPLSPIINTSLAHVLYYARRYDEAIAQYRKSIELDSKLLQPRDGLVLALIGKKKYLEAIAEYEQLSRLVEKYNQESSRIKEIRNVFLKNGEKGFWQKKLEFDLQDPDAPYEIACDYSILGQKDKAFEWLSKSIQVRDQSLDEMKPDPRMDPLGSDPRFKEYLSLMNLD